MPRPRRRRPRRPAWATALGVLLLVVGLGCLGWVGYAYVGSGVVAHRAYERESGGLRSRWASPPAPVPGTTAPGATAPGANATVVDRVPGTALALLRVPRFGAGY